MLFLTVKLREILFAEYICKLQLFSHFYLIEGIKNAILLENYFFLVILKTFLPRFRVAKGKRSILIRLPFDKLTFRDTCELKLQQQGLEKANYEKSYSRFSLAALDLANAISFDDSCAYARLYKQLKADISLFLLRTAFSLIFYLYFAPRWNVSTLSIFPPYIYVY